MEQIADIIVQVARLLVDKSDEVKVQLVPLDQGVQILLSVAPEDTSKIIGKAGNTARSLRILLGAMSKTSGQTISLEIAEAGTKTQREAAVSRPS